MSYITQLLFKITPVYCQVFRLHGIVCGVGGTRWDGGRDQ